ncbi:DUF3347 domain-containing protein [Persicitalea sp.]|uniref:DUF3347 domain-containing protein n=1 Tax=Persicitalea sp. TaxID=3100273 RepID=UPI003594397E
MKKVFLSLAVAAMLSSCSNDTSQQSADQAEMIHDADGHEHDETATTLSNVPLDGPIRKSENASGILDNYLEIKEALVSENSDKAATSGNALAKEFASFDKASLDAVQRASYEKLVGEALEQAEHIGESKGKIDHQREHFDALSTSMMSLIAVIGSDRTLYHDYCPMYNDNKGANWLSSNEEIENPYYGSKMLTCGSMKKEIVPQ